MLEPIPFAGYVEIDEMNKPVAWMLKTGHGTKILEVKPYCEVDYWIPLYTHPANACKHGVDDGACKECYLEATHPIKELNAGGEPVKNATYWKRQHDNVLMKLNICAIKVSELEKQLDIRTRELIGASFYEHDYKTLMAKPPLTDKEIEQIGRKEFGYWDSYNEELLDFARAILRKASE